MPGDEVKSNIITVIITQPIAPTVVYKPLPIFSSFTCLASISCYFFQIIRPSNVFPRLDRQSSLTPFGHSWLPFYYPFGPPTVFSSYQMTCTVPLQQGSFSQLRLCLLASEVVQWIHGFKASPLNIARSQLIELFATYLLIFVPLLRSPLHMFCSGRTQ